ncbi:MAG: ABC transporter ATP-binding protein [Bacteroidota bacterium]|uniref:ABC-type multidrug transport system, ATPase component n=1 Tax=Algoriphagus faecimaris TaxID=686796 RepID=A0A1G6TP47_9BACT|nr:ABC transporter ATP-binding protein [Algoriphagus faecimaris]SDD30883.1 ABC-type multidrug transport system, ATPase component [Algoriphagus faecimaris]
MLQVKNLIKKYGKHLAVDDVSFSLDGGEVVGLLGPNGAGKSTTMKCIVGLLRKTSGEITIGGHDHLSVEAKRFFSYIPETPYVYDLLTVREHLQFIAQAYGVTDWKEKGEQLLDTYDLIDKADKLGRDLSKGMRQKVSICCALLPDPKVLFFDEPMIGLDPKAIKNTKRIFANLKEAGKTILVSTHLIDSVETIADRIMIMKDGKILGNDTIANLKRQFVSPENESLEDIFLELTKDARD